MGKCIDGIEKDASIYCSLTGGLGNVREVENAIEYAINMEESGVIRAGRSPDKITGAKHLRRDVGSRSLKGQLESVERDILLESLKRNGSSLEGKRRAAKELEISESTLYRRMRALGIR